jgi:hypothetical protein
MAAEPELKIPVLTDEVADYVAESDAGAMTVASQTEAQETAGSDTTAATAGSVLSEADREALIAELQTELASRTFELTDHIMRSAFAQMEANVFAQISGRLRSELPEIIDALLRERLSEDPDY